MKLQEAERVVMLAWTEKTLASFAEMDGVGKETIAKVADAFSYCGIRALRKYVIDSGERTTVDAVLGCYSEYASVGDAVRETGWHESDICRAVVTRFADGIIIRNI